MTGPTPLLRSRLLVSPARRGEGWPNRSNKNNSNRCSTMEALSDERALWFGDIRGLTQTTEWNWRPFIRVHYGLWWNWSCLSYRVAVGDVPFFDPNCSLLSSDLYTRWQRFKWFSETINRKRRARFLSKFCMSLLSHQFTKESNHLRNSAENSKLLHIHVIYNQRSRYL